MREEHEIEALMMTAMDSIRDMIDVNTIIGESIKMGEDISIIPISRVCFGFAAGGSEFKGESMEDYKRKDEEENITYRNPFGGGSGAGVSIKPIAFLTVQGKTVRLLPVEKNCTIDKILDYVPELFEKTEKIVQKMMDKKEENPKVQKVDINYEYNYNNKENEEE